MKIWNIKDYVDIGNDNDKNDNDYEKNIYFDILQFNSLLEY